MDCKNLDSDRFVKEMEGLCVSYSKDNIKASIKYYKTDDLGGIQIDLRMKVPENWEGEPGLDRSNALNLTDLSLSSNDYSGGVLALF